MLAEEQREIDPIGLLWAGGEGAGDDLEDRAELAVVDADHDRAARVRTSGLGPAARDHGEVLDVEGDEDPLFGRGDRQQLLVGETVELTLFVRGSNVVALVAERRGDAPCRDVRVEEELHGASGARSHIDTADGYEREFLFELLDRPPVLGDGRVDLLAKQLVVVEGQAGSDARWRSRPRPCSRSTRCRDGRRRSATRRARSPSPTRAAPSPRRGTRSPGTASSAAPPPRALRRSLRCCDPCALPPDRPAPPSAWTGAC